MKGTVTYTYILERRVGGDGFTTRSTIKRTYTTSSPLRIGSMVRITKARNHSSELWLVTEGERSE